MMGKDESMALEMLRESRAIHLSLFKKHGGTCLKEMGDGMLAWFDHAVEAVRCAGEIQMQASKRLECKIRIGIHLGKVHLENNDVFGNDVNIASRLQSIADPGGIYISDAVFDASKGTTDLQATLIGDVFLKNVVHAVTTYAVKGKGIPLPSSARIKELTGTDEIDSVAVLPFINITGQSDQQYFIDGMQDALISELSQISSLRVISRTSTIKYRDTVKPIPEIAAELGVDALMEASVLREENMVRIDAKLIKAVPTEMQIWSNSYDREIRNVFSMYNEVVKDITSEIGTQLTSVEQGHLESSYEVDPDAYEAYLKGIFHWEKLNKEGLANSLASFERSTELDPRFAPAYSGMAGVWLGRTQMGLVPRDEALPHVYSNIYKSIDLDDSIADSYFWRATLNVWIDWDWQKGLQSFRKAIMNNTNFALGRAYYSHLLIILGQISEAVEEIELAVDLDPFNTLIQSLYGMVLNYSRQYGKATDVLIKLLRDGNSHPIALSTLRSVYHNMGEFDQAYEIFRKSYLEKGDKQAAKTLASGFREGGYRKALNDVAELKMKLSESVYNTPWQIATLFTRAGDKKRAIEFLHRAYEVKDPNIPYVGIDPIFDEISSEPDYLQLLDKLNLNKTLNNYTPS